MKTCIACDKRKPLSMYYKHPAMSDGHLNKCRACCLAYARRRRETCPIVRERDRARAKTADRKSKALLHQRRSRQKPTERLKRAARQLVAYAIKCGRLRRQPCEVCGSSKRVHAHHDDYSKPMKVRWMCALHHSRYHRDNPMVVR